MFFYNLALDIQHSDPAQSLTLSGNFTCSCTITFFITIFLQNTLWRTIRASFRKNQIIVKFLGTLNWFCFIYSQLLKCSTALRGSSNWFSKVSSTKVKGGLYFLFTEPFPCIENKEHLIDFIIAWNDMIKWTVLYIL